jgi:hypothetical protein
MDIVKSTDRYEAWLRKQLKGEMVEKDLKKKHKKMAQDPFLFLRATYWRWAETILDVCPDLKHGPQVLAVGDIHIENFGTWRDAEGRLIWGVNDFDEAARMPYAVDIVRLATSAALAIPGISRRKICGNILKGYRAGLEDPKPFVLDREHPSLREISVVSEDARTAFWDKFDPARIDRKRPKNVTPFAAVPPRYAKVLKRSRPDGNVSFRYFARAGGTGSLGRPRIFGSGDWHGDLVVREAKAIVRSAWVLAHRSSRNLRSEEIASGRYRSPDPTYRLDGRVLVRRLSPNDFKIEAKQEQDPAKGGKKAATTEQENPKAVDRRDLLDADVLCAMGRDLAAIHRATRSRRKAIAADLKRRKAGWLSAGVTAAARALQQDFKQWKAHHDRADDAG